MPAQPGWPDLSEFVEDADHYYAIHHALWTSSDPDWEQRAPATWGLIARGADSLPYVRLMLASHDPDERADGAGVLGAIAQAKPELADTLLDLLGTEHDTEVRDTLIVSLGQLRVRKAAAAIGDIVSDASEDGDTRDLAAHALGRIGRQAFDKAPDPVEAAAQWWAAHRGDWDG